MTTKPSDAVTDGVIVLRPVRPNDRPLLDLLASPEQAGHFNSFPTSDALRMPDVGGSKRIITTPDDEPVGDVGWFGVPYGPNHRSVAWRIGITVLVEQRGRGYGSRAQSLLATYLFKTTASNRVEADVDVNNTPERRALLRAGFTEEGVVRGAQHREDAWHDLILYSRLRGD
jgi:RimJ/RimL family protein N-acetyltransferase